MSVYQHDTELKQVNMRMALCVVASAWALNSVAEPVMVERAELDEIRHELRLLRSDMARMERLLLESAAYPSAESGAVPESVWGCYMKDVKAGGVYGTGLTEAEAKGRTLEQCERKDGSCFESDLKCTKS